MEHQLSTHEKKINLLFKTMMKEGLVTGGGGRGGKDKKEKSRGKKYYRVMGNQT